MGITGRETEEGDSVLSGKGSGSLTVQHANGEVETVVGTLGP